MAKLFLQPVTLREAKDFVNQHHRHHIAPVGHKFSIGVNDGEKLVGVIVVGRPVARHLDDGWTLEVTRCCTDGTKNAASKLYGAAWRAASAMGYKRLITYTLIEESGITLRAVGWKALYQSPGGGSWNNQSRARIDKHPTGPKTLWEVKSEDMQDEKIAQFVEENKRHKKKEKQTDRTPLTDSLF